MSSTLIFCEQFNPIWQKGIIYPSLKDVNIWKMNVPEFNLIPENILSKDELLKANRFLHSKDRASFVSRRATLRILLSRYTDIPPSEIDFISGKNKKPEIRSELNKIRFNVSHSGELILIAISDTEIGVDIERIETSFNYSDILINSFSEEEITCIEQIADSREFFFRLWSRKEALCKASSKGLDDDLKDIPSLDGCHTINEDLIGLNGNWQLKSFNIDQEYMGSIACQAEKKINYLNFEF